MSERGARLARRKERAYREYSSDEQRRQAGCPAREALLKWPIQATSRRRRRPVPHRAPGASGSQKPQYLSGKPITYYRPRGSAEVRALIDEGFQAFNAARLSEACRIYTDKMLAPESDTTIALTVAGALTPAGLGGGIVELMERGPGGFLISTRADPYSDLHHAPHFTPHPRG